MPLPGGTPRRTGCVPRPIPGRSRPTGQTPWPIPPARCRRWHRSRIRCRRPRPTRSIRAAPPCRSTHRVRTTRGPRPSRVTRLTRPRPGARRGPPRIRRRNGGDVDPGWTRAGSRHRRTSRGRAGPQGGSFPPHHRHHRVGMPCCPHTLRTPARSSTPCRHRPPEARPTSLASRSPLFRAASRVQPSPPRPAMTVPDRHPHRRPRTWSASGNRPHCRGSRRSSNRTSPVRRMVAGRRSEPS